ncbi:MAG TPA: PQQ-like beta-propeller repeat protein [Anaerolineae bacterium]|nr:PQQ-like beta-propeller repeat protein [Anaerolineae bacterium]
MPSRPVLLTLLFSVFLFAGSGPLPVTLASSPSHGNTLPSYAQPALFQSDPSDPQEMSWSMAGANPQRTSWVAEGVDPTAAEAFGLEWFRPIEAYIGQHVQLITARDKVYVATARGLYVLHAATGEVAWRFDTELPLGHSPTVVGNVVYAGGFDKRVYALNADTGTLLWTFAGAKGGFSTNPLVVEGKVLLGSRDGYFYALDQDNGRLAWQYPATGQAPLGPILYSAAYKDGQVFFAANDNYAYALNVENGALRWRSEKLPGDGYQGWWPVVYENYVVFSAALAYAEEAGPGTRSVVDVVDPTDPYYAQMHDFQYSQDLVKTIQRDDVFHQNEATGVLLGPEFKAGSSVDTTGLTWLWPKGESVIDAAKVTEYLEDDGQVKLNRPTNKPWRRGVIVLDVSNGVEYTFDSDEDGQPEYAPFLFAGTKSGNRYPPLVIPTKKADGVRSDVLYAQNFYDYVFNDGWGISGARLTAWQFGTPYLRAVGERFAVDEPFADSAGGTILYQNLCCDRIGLARNLETGEAVQFWGYAGWTLESLKYEWSEIEPWMASLAPGYDEMWSGTSMYDYYPRLYGNYGTLNGIYHNHGLQNPIIPYQGRLFVHRSNAVIALGPDPVRIRQVTQNETPSEYEQHIREEYPQFAKPLLKINTPDQDQPPTLSLEEVQVSLDRQIAAILETGHLRPGYYNSTRGMPQFANYFENPGDTLFILLQAYPYVSPTLKPDLEKYLKQHYRMYFEDNLFARTGYWRNGSGAYNLNDSQGFGQLQPREWMPLPPEVAEDIKQYSASLWPGVDWPWEYPQHNIYAMWQFGQTFYADDPVQLTAIYNQAKARLETTPPGPATLEEYTWVHNGFIAGYLGFLKLQELAGQAQQDAELRATVETQLNALLALRAKDFNKDNPWSGPEAFDNGQIINKSFSVARNFMYLTPELAQYLRQHALDQVTEAVDEYNWTAPYWVAVRYEASFSEFASDHLYTHNSMFQAKAYILQESRAQLLKYLDVPAFKVGDLFYIQNLVAILAR